jgi:Na+/proline symporter
MGYFGTIDLVLMGIYALALVAMGFYLKRLASDSIEDYIIGAGKIPWWAMGISGMAQFLDLTGTALIVSFLFMLGPQGLFIEFRGGAVLVLVLMMLWVGKWHRRSSCLTGAEWNIFRFGACWGGRFAQLISVLAVVLGTIGMLAYLTKGVGLFLSTFLPFPPDHCAYMLIFLAAIYTMFSGFYGVIYTDLFQGMIIIIAVIYVSFKAFMLIGGSNEIAEVALQVTNNPDWVSSIPKWHANMPKGYEQYTALIPLMFFYLLKNILQGAGNIGDPKFFGAKNDRECSKMSVLWTIMMTFRWPMMMGIAVLGLFLVRDLFPDMSVLSQAAVLVKNHHPEVTQNGWAALIANLSNSPELYSTELTHGLKSLLGPEQFIEKLNLLSFDGTVNPEKILPAVLIMTVGEGLRGLLVLALIAASMSTFDSTVNLATGMMVNDFYRKYLRPQATTKELIQVSWFFVSLLVIGGVLFAQHADSIQDIWGWLMMGLGGAFLVPNLLRLYWWRFNGTGSAVGSLVGMSAAVLQRLLWPEMDEVLQLGYALIAGLIGAIIGTYADKATDAEVLKLFYLKTRPFGFWGKLKAQLPLEEQKKVNQEHLTDLRAIPLALIWQVSMFLAPMLLVIHNWEGFGFTLLLFVLSGSALYWFWYRKQPQGNLYGEDEPRASSS